MDAVDNKFTLIVHGPLTMYTVFTLYRHAETFPIVIVAPRPSELSNNNILKEIQTFMDRKDKRVSLFLYDDTIDTKTINNAQNRYYHFYSVYLGLQSCSTPYTIKLRSDEFYSNLEPITSAVKEHKNKLVTTEVFFRNCGMPYHPSDHIVAGATDVMLEVFQAAKHWCEGINVEGTVPFKAYIANITNKPFVSAEQYLGVSAALTQIPGNKLKEPDCTSIMKELFHIVKTDELGMFRVMFNSANPKPLEYIDNSFYSTDEDIDDMKNYICEKKV